MMLVSATVSTMTATVQLMKAARVLQVRLRLVSSARKITEMSVNAQTAFRHAK
jgi:hypothetical protein